MLRHEYELVILLWAALFFVIAIILGMIAFNGIAIAVSLFTKILFLFSLICFVVAFVLIIVEKVIARAEISKNE